MSELDDHQLLAEFARKNSEAAFAALVQRHVNLVYSVALRSVGNVHDAEEITQAVFIILARKAKSFSRKTILSGWLYQTTQLTAANFLRGKIRRQKREQEAYMQSALNKSEPDVWPQIAPLLDDALGKLGEKDRDAIVLRFFENKNLRDVGAALGASEDAAKMRVNRALEKLRKIFAKRGATFSAALIAGAVSANSVQAAPVGLAKTISAVAIAKGAAAGGSTLALVKGALKIMAWTKAKMAIVAGAVVLLAAGTTTITVKEIQEHRTYPWQIAGQDSRVLDRQPPQVRILSSKVKYGSWGRNTDKNGNAKLMGTGVSAETVLLNAYDFSYPSRVIGSDKLPDGKYDYIACLPMGNEEALQKEAKKKLRVIARVETKESDVLLLKIRNRNASGLKQSREDFQNGGGNTREDGPGSWSCKNSSLSSLAAYLEEYLRTPVIQQTGLTNSFDINLKWKQVNWGNTNPDGLKQALLDQLGFELVSSREPVEMLVVEKVK
jgi:uncharacterized protein (TIGR03435 family)